MFGYSTHSDRSKAFVFSPLIDVLSSTCWDLDATVFKSYDGSSQTFSNIVASPADGSTQTNYDFFLGQTGSSDTDDPSFTGSSGNRSAYFNLDGGDHYKAKASATTDMITMNKMHQIGAGEAWWMGLAFRYADNAAAQQFFRTDVTTGNDFRSGIAFSVQSDDTLLFHRRESDASQSFDQDTTTVTTLTDATDYLILVTRDDDTDSLDFWINSKTATETFTVDWTNNTTGATGNAGSPDTAKLPALAARDFTSIDFQMGNGTRFYGFYGGNEFLNDTKAGQIVDHLNSRHNRTYA